MICYICNLCSTAKFYILFKRDMATLNKRNKLMSTCRRKRKFLLKLNRIPIVDLIYDTHHLCTPLRWLFRLKAMSRFFLGGKLNRGKVCLFWTTKKWKTFYLEWYGAQYWSAMQILCSIFPFLTFFSNFFPDFFRPTGFPTFPQTFFPTFFPTFFSTSFPTFFSTFLSTFFLACVEGAWN